LEEHITTAGAKKFKENDHLAELFTNPRLVPVARQHGLKAIRSMDKDQELLNSTSHHGHVGFTPRGLTGCKTTDWPDPSFAIALQFQKGVEIEHGPPEPFLEKAYSTHGRTCSFSVFERTMVGTSPMTM
jgi:hypothetical protein